jgi:hypothetical protein
VQALISERLRENIKRIEKIENKAVKNSRYFLCYEFPESVRGDKQQKLLDKFKKLVETPCIVRKKCREGLVKDSLIVDKKYYAPFKLKVLDGSDVGDIRWPCLKVGELQNEASDSSVVLLYVNFDIQLSHKAVDAARKQTNKQIKSCVDYSVCDKSALDFSA